MFVVMKMLWRFFCQQFLHFGPWPSRMQRSENTIGSWRMIPPMPFPLIQPSVHARSASPKGAWGLWVVVGDLKIWIWRGFYMLLCRLQNTFIFENLPFVWLADVFGPLVGRFFSCLRLGVVKWFRFRNHTRMKRPSPSDSFLDAIIQNTTDEEEFAIWTLCQSDWSITLYNIFFLSTWSSMIVICEEVQWYDKPKFSHSSCWAQQNDSQRHLVIDLWLPGFTPYS